MNTKIVLFLLIICTLKVSAQSNIELSIENLRTNTDSLFVQFSFANTGEKIIKLYMPESQDICYGIVRILIKDIQGAKYQIMPCSEIIDLDAIILSCKNSLYLAPDEKVVEKIKFSLKDVAPFLPKGEELEAVMEINLKDVSFEGDICELIKCNFKSKNKIKFKL